MFRSALRPYFALLLLFCLGRTLLPEAWVLALHAHRHTTHEAAYAGPSSKHRLLLTARHQHCHAEQFYNVPFAPASIVQLLGRPLRRQFACWRVARVRQGAAPMRLAPGQRGPPLPA